MENGLDVIVEETYTFGQLWDGDGDGRDLLESECICIGADADDLPVIAGFKLLEPSEEILDAVVQIVDIY